MSYGLRWDLPGLRGSRRGSLSVAGFCCLSNGHGQDLSEGGVGMSVGQDPAHMLQRFQRSHSGGTRTVECSNGRGSGFGPDTVRQYGFALSTETFGGGGLLQDIAGIRVGFRGGGIGACLGKRIAKGRTRGFHIGIGPVGTVPVEIKWRKQPFDEPFFHIRRAFVGYP